MTSVYSILLQLENTSSTNEKLAILNQHRDNPELKEFFRLALDDTCFYIKQIPKHSPDVIGKVDLKFAMRNIQFLSDRAITGHAAIEFLYSLLCDLSTSHADVICRIIKKDPNCGVSDKTVNKVWKGLIKETPYMRCEKPSGIVKIKYPAIIQTKSDGMFANIIVEDNDIVVKSRNGKHIDLLGIFEGKLYGLRGGVYHGELLVVRNGIILDRKTGNGILNKAIKGTITPEEADMIVCRLWDVVPVEDWLRGKCTQTYHQRFGLLVGNITEHNFGNIVTKIDHAFVNNMEEAQLFYQKQIDQGYEGAVIKNLDGIWENKTSKNNVKMKPVDDCDLLCYDILPHSKDPSLIGALCFKTSDDRLFVNVGSGMTDRLRAMPKEYFINKVWIVYYGEVITSKNKEEYSLFLPRFSEEERPDKSEADTLERILS